MSISAIGNLADELDTRKQNLVLLDVQHGGIRPVSAVLGGGDVTGKEIAIALGKQVAKGKHLSCPMCSPGAMDDDQPMSSWGDHEYKLFCPHCDLTVQLNVIYNPGEK